MKKLEKAPNWYDDELYEKARLFKKEHNIDQVIRDLNNPYQYWDKVKYKKTTLNIDPDILWTLVKLSRIYYNELKFGKYRFTFNTTNNINKGLHEFDMNFGGNLQSQTSIHPQDKQRFLLNSIMEEAIASSQIEGAVTTRQAAKEMLRKASKPKNKSEQMIMNNYQTIRHIVDHRDLPLNKETLFEIHKLVSNQTLDNQSDEGKYRSNDNINVVDSLDGEIVHSPPDFQEIELLMDDLFTFFNTTDEEVFIHPIVKACIIHFMIGFIHPFVDGNGRTARALFYWYLLKNGYWLTEYLSISRLIMKSKNQYALAFIYTETDQNDLTYFIDYNIKTMRLAYEELKAYILRKTKEKKELINFQKLAGVNERQAAILNWTTEEPDSVFSVKEIENRFNISNQTARTDLQSLSELGYLDEVNVNKKSKVYVKGDRFDNLLNQ